MGFRASAFGFSWAVIGLLTVPVLAQPPAAPADAPKTPVELYRSARDFIREGRFDVAAEELKKFLAANPPDAVYLDIQKNEATAFLRLRNVGRWSEDAASNQEAIKTVEAIIARAEESNKKFYQDPARIAKFVRNLGATYEERVYAEQQLKLSGDAVVPVMVEVLRTSNEIPQRAGILDAMSRLPMETVPGFLAAAEGLNDDLRLGIFRALSARQDVLSLVSSVDTNFVPDLWYYSVAPGEPASSLRLFSKNLLSQYSAGRSEKQLPEDELTRFATDCSTGKARYRDPGSIKLWTWDASRMNVVAIPVKKDQADDFYTFRYVKWALDRNPKYLPAEELFITHAVDRTVRKAGFRDLAEVDPTLYQILATAPSDILINLATQALREQKTSVAYGLTLVLAVRSDKSAAESPAPGKPSLFARALDYPDPRVQLAGAVGLLRTPTTSNHGLHSRVVEVLRRAAAGEQLPAGAKSAGRVFLADPFDIRAEKMATFLRDLGYTVERFPTGRELLLRVKRASDGDLIIVDRHIGGPDVTEIVAQLQPDGSKVRTPVLVVASSNQPKAVPIDYLLLRLALLIAVTETPTVEVPAPFSFDPRKAIANEAAERAQIRARRDRTLQDFYSTRLERLKRLINASNLPYSNALQARLDARTAQLTYAALTAEYGISPESAPEMYKQFVAQNSVVLNRPEWTQQSIDVPTQNISRLIEQLDTVLTPAQRQLFNTVQQSINRESLGLPPDSSRDLNLERDLERKMVRYPSVSVIPEPFSVIGLAEDLRNATPIQAQLPRDPQQKKVAAAVAIDWLRRMAINEVSGYDVRPAELELRKALADNDLAEIALEAVARIPTAEVQQDLVGVAMSGMRPLPLREKAGDRAIRHIQAYGKLTPANMNAPLVKAADAETVNNMKAKLLVIHQLLFGKPDELGQLMAGYPLPSFAAPAPAKDAPPADPMKKADEPKN